MTREGRRSRKPGRDELAERLRENLRRRKAQQRARRPREDSGGEGHGPDDAVPSSSGDDG